MQSYACRFHHLSLHRRASEKEDVERLYIFLQKIFEAEARGPRHGMNRGRICSSAQLYGIGSLDVHKERLKPQLPLGDLLARAGETYLLLGSWYDLLVTFQTRGGSLQVIQQ